MRWIGTPCRNFFDRSSESVARELLGQRLVHEEDGFRVAGIISETEAYSGSEDLASHARSGRTQRNAAMWGPPGHIYMYFTYGIHWMFNIVTEQYGSPSAVLIRGVIPAEGIDPMRQRRGGKPDTLLADGPGKLCQAFDMDGRHYGVDLCQQGSSIWIEHGQSIPDSAVSIGPRVGLNNVPEPWKSLPRHYRLEEDDLLRRSLDPASELNSSWRKTTK